MPSITLKWDISKKLFSVPVHLSRNISKMRERPESYNCDVMMYVDTGSGISSITDKEAYELGYDISSLEKMRVVGIGGFTETPIAHGITVFFFLTDGSPYGLNLEKIMVSPEQVNKVREKTRGDYRQTHTINAEMPKLLGLDAIEKLGGELRLNLRDKTGEIIF